MFDDRRALARPESASTVALPAAIPPGSAPPGSVHREAEAAHAALRVALAAFGLTQLGAAHDSQEVDRGQGEGGPVARPHAAGGHIRRRERRAWEAHEGAHDGVYRAVSAYARALRRNDVGLPAALVTVRATVGDLAWGLAPAVQAALQRDATRGCVEAFTRA